jgi:hypothetical protein
MEENRILEIVIIGPFAVLTYLMAYGLKNKDIRYVAMTFLPLYLVFGWVVYKIIF